jgi:hypothetical protein
MQVGKSQIGVDFVGPVMVSKQGKIQNSLWIKTAFKVKAEEPTLLKESEEGGYPQYRNLIRNKITPVQRDVGRNAMLASSPRLSGCFVLFFI